MSDEPSPAAWHSDPVGRHDQRYWDGNQWTDLVAAAAGGEAERDPIRAEEIVTPPGHELESEAAAPADERPASWTGQPSPVFVYATVGPKTNGLAVAALVLGILPLAGVGSLLAIVLGLVARRQIDNSDGAQSGREMASAGFVLGCIWLALTAVAVIAFAI